MSKYKLTKLQTVYELLRPYLLLALYILFALKGWWILAVLFAFFTLLSAFVQMHDTIHNSLGIGKDGNDLMLSISGLLLLKSGHAMQVTHLRHHAQCLTDRDPEGEPANWKFRKVLFQGPYHIFMLRFASYEMAPSSRQKQIVETICMSIIAICLIGSYFWFDTWIGLCYFLVTFFMSATMPIWATYIPHHLAPDNPLRKVSIKLVQWWTPVISSFAFHHVHHHHSKVPTALLPKVALDEIEKGIEHYHEH